MTGTELADEPADPGADQPFALDEVGEVAASFRTFADTAVRRLPLYHRLCGGVADDHEVAALLLGARPGQRQPILLLAAVHHALLGHTEDPLADWYSSVNPHPRRVGRGDDDPWPHFRRVALEHPQVRHDIATRAVQTNEVGRCTPLVLALDHIVRHAPEAIRGRARSVGLIDLGASAGLNLLLDRYGYRLTPSGQELHAGSPLILESEMRGTNVPDLPAAFPHVTSRVGLDREPLDLHDRDQARWLVACQWPDQPERVHRLRTAIALAHGGVPEVVRGDVADDLAPLVGDVAPVSLPVLTATWSLSYLADEHRTRLLAVLDGLGAERDLSLVIADDPLGLGGLPVPPRPDGVPDGLPTALLALHWRDGVRSAERLADMHPHGTWIEWLAR